MNTFGLKAGQIQLMNACFAQYPAIQQVIIYGSRAKGTYRNGSDIDLSIVAEAFSFSDLLALETALDDLLLPYKIDLSLKKDIDNPDLLEHIERVGQVFYLAQVVEQPNG